MVCQLPDLTLEQVSQRQDIDTAITILGAIADGTPVTSGYIALQAESHPYEFRKVELLDLSK